MLMTVGMVVSRLGYERARSREKKGCNELHLTILAQEFCPGYSDSVSCCKSMPERDLSKIFSQSIRRRVGTYIATLRSA